MVICRLEYSLLADVNIRIPRKRLIELNCFVHIAGYIFYNLSHHFGLSCTTLFK